jgi:DNA-binding response OmpR family regulator
MEAFVLEKEGFQVITAENGEEALKTALEQHPDVILLDIVIPGPDGFEVCRRLREAKFFAPIIFVTARKEQWDQVAGLSIGGDHYIVKPFSPAYLVSLIRASLRRETAYRSDDESSRLCLGGVSIDLPARLAMQDDVEVHLTPGEWMVLETLAENRGKVINREELQERLWDAVSDEGINSRTVDMHISRLRQKLGDKNAEMISTVRNMGYRLNRDARSASS